MLRLARETRTSAGRLCTSDMAQGVPLRTAAFDLAISISAVQWICANEHPEKAVQCFFNALWRCLKADGKAAFQVYLESTLKNSQTNVMDGWYCYRIA